MKQCFKNIFCGALALAVMGQLWAAPCLAVGIPTATNADFDVPCKAAILIDEDSGTVLYEKEADEKRPIASITKVMTLLLTFEALESGKIKLQDTVPISAHAYGMGGSQIWLEPGEQFTLEELLKAVCICSANDAAVAVAEFVGGSEPVFVQAMNDRAADLGMTNTHFCNACGLDEEGHLSTARDVAAMSREMLLHHTEVADYCTVWMDTLRDGATQLVNTNKMLRSYQGITGLKTGTTGGAGVCISASAERGGLRLIAVVLGANSSKERFAAAQALLDYGYATCESVQVELPAQAPKTLPVNHGVEEWATLRYATPTRYLVPKGEGAALTVELTLPDAIDAPLAAGQKIGKASVKQNGTLLEEYSVTVDADIRRLDFGTAFGRLLHTIAMGKTDNTKDAEKASDSA